MGDKWRASVCSIGGQLVAVVDVEIRRTLFIDPNFSSAFKVRQKSKVFVLRVSQPPKTSFARFRRRHHQDGVRLLRT